MSKRQWLIIFGVLIIILPFMGFPSTWKTVISISLGVLIIVSAYREGTVETVIRDETETFTEHKNSDTITRSSTIEQK